jgi:DNA-binding NarL/FixJ family response regulator
MTTVIADTSVLNRSFLRLALERVAPVAAHDVVEVTTTAALLAQVERLQPELIVFDPAVDYRPVAAQVEELVRRAPLAIVLVVSGRSSVVDAARATGAMVALKRSLFGTSEIEDAIARVYARAGSPYSERNESNSDSNLDLSADFSSSDAQQDSMPDKLNDSIDSRSQPNALCTAA